MQGFISKNNKKELIYTAVSIVILFICWKLISTIVDREILIPSPETTFAEVIRIAKSPNFTLSLANTLKRAVMGFGFALVTGAGLGMLAGVSKVVYYLLRPLVLVVKAVPTMAMILLALIWLESEKAPILVGFVIIFPVIYENVMQGIRSIDKNLLEMMRIYNLDKLTILKDLYIPSIMPYLKSAMAAAMGLNLKIIIAAEVLSQPKISMGTSFQIEKANLNTAGVFAWSIVTVILAALLEKGISSFSKYK